MRKLLLILLVGGLLPVCALAQNFSIRVSTNYPVIADVTKEATFTPMPVSPSSGYTSYTTNTGSLEDRYSEKPGFDLTSKFHVYSFKGFFLESGLSVQFYRFKRSTHVNELNSLQNITLDLNGTPINIGSPYGGIYGYPIVRDPSGNVIVNSSGDPIAFEVSPKTGETTTLYLQVPVIAGKSLFKNKLCIKIGLTANILLQGTEYKTVYNAGTFAGYKDKSGDGFNDFLVNGMFETTYFVTKNIGLDLSYQRSFNSIYDQSPAGKSYYNIFSFGASYHFFKQSKN